jgi:hypothetical protein
MKKVGGKTINHKLGFLSRGTRLGEFLPIGQLFSVSNFLKITEAANF